MPYDRLLIPALFVLGTLLSACAEQRPTTTPLDFATSPYILRGVWTGTDGQGDALLLDLDASDLSAEGYLVTGTFQLNDEEPVVIEGWHAMPVTSSAGTMSALLSPTDPFVAYSIPDGRLLSGGIVTGSPPSFTAYLDLDKDVSAQYFEMTAQADTDLLNTKWTLETLLGERLIEGSIITLKFGDAPHEGLNGSDGCNYYGASYMATETVFSVVYRVSTTDMACKTPQGVMAQATAYSQAFSDVTTYRITEGRLELIDAAGMETLVFKETP